MPPCIAAGSLEEPEIMREFFPVFFSIAVIAVISMLEITLLKRLHPSWWRRRAVRTLSYAMPLVGFLALTAWTAGIFLSVREVALAGSYLVATVLVAGVALMISLPFSGLLHRVSARTVARRKSASDAGKQLRERRAFLTTAAAALPVAAIATGGAGIAGSLRDPVLPEIPMSFAGLPSALAGLRIAHISDVHLGLYLGLPDFERMAELLAHAKPDLVLITGDLADDPSIYADVLRLAASIPNRYGVFATLGNHEYFRDIAAVHRAFDRGPVPLLLNSGHTLSVGGALLHLAGIDDPRALGKVPESYFAAAVKRAVADAPSDAFTLLMSHRPEGFNAAVELGIPFTISGHTHGGQVGLMGRSLFEQLLPEKYMWGAYERSGSRLYTSAGAGHWFPCRLGCPAEIPIYTLTRQHAHSAPATRDTAPRLHIDTSSRPPRP
jgi:predicted MPP superfamily phosphohydrolase